MTEKHTSVSIETIEHQFEAHRRVLDECSKLLPEALHGVISAASACLDKGGKLLVCGNGGSAADAQHLAAELVCRVRNHRRALPALALTTNASALTAIANDYGYEQVFARQIEAMANPGDMLIAISTSGRSPNVIAAARKARLMSCSVVVLTGRDGGELAGLADHILAVPADIVSLIQEMHSLCIHILAESLERQMTGYEEDR